MCTLRPALKTPDVEAEADVSGDKTARYEGTAV
jgi:hypothetical protein